jgi:hypothetical protein
MKCKEADRLFDDAWFHLEWRGITWISASVISSPDNLYRGFLNPPVPAQFQHPADLEKATPQGLETCATLFCASAPERL